MNIQLITPKIFIQNNYPLKLKGNDNKFCMNNNLAPLTSDIVSFGVGEKKKKKGAFTVNYGDALDVVEEAQADSAELKFVLRKHLKQLIASSKNPKGPICPGERGISVRVKTEDSIRDKVTPRGITTKWGIKNVGDIIGGRIVLRDGSSKAVDSVLEALANAVKQGDLRVVEIEKYNPKAGKFLINDRDMGYGTSEGLNALETASGVIARVGPQPSGYPAIHITIKTKHGFKAEIQIMGVDVEDLKHVEDLGYKMRCGKGIPTEYKSLEPKYAKAFSTIEENELDDAYLEYVNDAYYTAFCLPVQKFNSRKKQEFLKIPYYLPTELDFNNMAKDMENCTRIVRNIKKTISSKDKKNETKKS